jgi:hypothetical protein
MPEGYWSNLRKENPTKYKELKRKERRRYKNKLKSERPDKYKDIKRRENKRYYDKLKKDPDRYHSVVTKSRILKELRIMKKEYLDECSCSTCGSNENNTFIEEHNKIINKLINSGCRDELSKELINSIVICIKCRKG